MIYITGFFYLFNQILMHTDSIMMSLALSLARKGAGWVNPNPMVGAVLVSEGDIIGKGFHEFFGGPHAEVNAILDAIKTNPGKIENSTLYVTLEPCNHIGKTPPCTDLIIEKKIGKVVVGIPDPNPHVTGKGIEKLTQAGIRVETGVLAPEINRFNEVFLKYVTTGMPFVLLKSAMTLDGKIATVTNASRWITGEKSRKEVHRLRARYSAVMVGVDTVISDDPMLNVRLKGEFKQPLKIVADTRLRIPVTSKITNHDPQLTIVATTKLADNAKIKELERTGIQVIVCPVKDDRVDLSWLFKALGTMGIDSILLEGGSTIAFSALNEGLVDKIVTFIAPKILGGASAPTPVGGEGIKKMENALCLNDMKFIKTGDDFQIEGYICKNLNEENQ